MARTQKQGLETITVSFRITQEQLSNLKKIVANQYLGGNKEEDMSHVVRLALDDYFITYYKDVL